MAFEQRAGGAENLENFVLCHGPVVFNLPAPDSSAISKG
jgi:hypothetical protein